MITEADRYVLAGRLKAYLKKYDESLALFSEGVERYPEHPNLLRHRAHRYITLREFDKAINDFSLAASLAEDRPDEIEYYQAEVEVDIFKLILGREAEVSDQHQVVTDDLVASTRHLYKSTLKSSIYYHWALSHYLKGEFEKASDLYRKALEVAVDNDMLVATSDWLYMSLRRGGQHEAAADLLSGISAETHPVVEPSYLRRIQLYRGELEPEALLDPEMKDKRSLATQGYGVGNWYGYSGEPEKARRVFEQILATGSSDAFGYIAAEVELSRANA